MSATQGSSLNEILKRLGALMGREHVSDDYVRFRSELLQAQTQVRAAAAEALVAPASDETEARALDPASVPMDPALLMSLVQSIQSAAGRQHQPEANLARLLQVAEQEPALLAELARKAAFGPEQEYLQSLGERLEIPPDVLLFVGRVLAAPFVTARGGAANAQDDGSLGATRSETGYCPTCGSPPGLALLKGEEGRRIFCCSLCGQRWAFARLACPHCGNRKQQSLVTLTVEDQSARWIEACEQCKGYIKTLDERKLPAGQAVVPLVEEAGTLHLDLLAEKEGYRPKLPYAALV
jgi:FdhE protein